MDFKAKRIVQTIVYDAIIINNNTSNSNNSTSNHIINTTSNYDYDSNNHHDDNSSININDPPVDMNMDIDINNCLSTQAAKQLFDSIGEVNQFKTEVANLQGRVYHQLRRLIRLGYVELAREERKGQIIISVFRRTSKKIINHHQHLIPNP